MMEGLINTLESIGTGLIGRGIRTGPEALDVILLGAVGAGIIRGYLRGGLQQASSIGSVVFGLWAGACCATDAADLISSYVELPRAVDAEIGFISAFVTAKLLVQVAGEVLGETVDTVGLGSLNKGLGGLIGGYKAALLTSALLFLGAEVGIPGPRVQSQSQWYHSVRQVLPTTWNTARSITPEIGSMRNAPRAFLRELKKRAQGLGNLPSVAHGSDLAGGEMRIEENYSKPFSNRELSFPSRKSRSQKDWISRSDQ